MEVGVVLGGGEGLEGGRGDDDDGEGFVPGGESAYANVGEQGGGAVDGFELEKGKVSVRNRRKLAI